MVTGSEFEQQFEARLGEEHALLRELMQSLERMKSALIAGSSVESILREKEQLLQQLENCTALRVQLLRHNGISHGPGGLGEALAEHGCSAALIERYQGFEQTVSACQLQNQSLGRLTKRRESFVNRALDALGSTGSSDNTYSSAGDNAGATTARWLGSA